MILNVFKFVLYQYVTNLYAKRMLFKYIGMYYNCRRRHSFLDNLSPKNYEKLWEMQKAA